MKLKDRILEHRASVMLYAVSWISLWVMFMAFASLTNNQHNSRLLDVVIFAGDASLVTSLFWLGGRRWRVAVIVPVAFFSLFFIANMCYMRCWGDTLPLRSLSMTGNVNSSLVSMASGLLDIADLWFALPFVAVVVTATVCYRHMGEEPGVPVLEKCILMVGALMVYLLSQTGIMLYSWYWSHKTGEPTSDMKELLFRRFTMRNLTSYGDSFSYNGASYPIAYMLWLGMTETSAMRELTEDEVADIDRFVASRPHWEPIADNREKNVILIIVESLNGPVIGRSAAGREITPYLNSLSESEDVLSTANMKIQTREGWSGDGQHIYNTGTLPLEYGSTAILVSPHDAFTPLVEQLGRRASLAVFGDNGQMWNKMLTFRLFGYDRVVTQNDFKDDARQRGADAAMFDHALACIDTLTQPFTACLLTMSMHVPFDDKGGQTVDWINPGSDVDPNEVSYLRQTAYFDRELKRFIESLMTNGLYNNTLIIIASDHSQAAGVPEAMIGREEDIPVVFMALNSGLKNVEINKPVGQIDVYPTVLQLAGCCPDAFRGLGVSMLNDTLDSAIDEDKIQHLSELMLRGNHLRF